MSRQRTMPGRGRTLVQRPDQVPADTRQAHRWRRPGLGQCLEPGQQTFLRQHQPWRPVTQVLRELRALPRPERLDAPRRVLNQRLDVLGAMQLTAGEVDTFERPVQRAHRRLELVESLDRLGALAPRPRQRPFGLAPARLVVRWRPTLSVSCPIAPAPHPRVPSPHRRAAPNAGAPCSSRKAHESNRRAAPPGETPRSPPPQSHAPHP